MTEDLQNKYVQVLIELLDAISAAIKSGDIDSVTIHSQALQRIASAA